MKCPICDARSYVYASSKRNNVIRRNLKCPKCGATFATIEQIVKVNNDPEMKGKMYMDLGAYANIENLSGIASANGIHMPRVRGYRLMSQETKITEGDIMCALDGAFSWLYHKACVTRFTFGSWSEYSPATRRLEKRYVIEDMDGEPSGFRWDRVHGKHRKALKFAMKKKERAIRAQYAMFNKYVGRNDVLYVHSRTGARNWAYYYKEILAIPGLLDHIEDANDGTYADYYFQIKPVEMNTNVSSEGREAL